jgi:glutamyl-tRNA reductase
MSGLAVSRALQDRFEAIRRAEVDRLAKKLRGLTEDERQLVESVTADVVRAIVCAPALALVRESQPDAADTLVHLFGL